MPTSIHEEDIEPEEDLTPPKGVATVEWMREAWRRASLARKASARILDAVTEQSGQIGQLMAAVSRTDRRVAEVADQMARGFERLGDIIDRQERQHDREHRRTEESHHDLEQKLQKQGRLIMLKNVSLPTALVVVALIVSCTVLLALGKPVPTWIVGLLGGGGIAGSVLPALLGGGKES